MKKTLSRKEIQLLLLKEVKSELLLEKRKRIAYSNFIDQILLENKNLLNSKHLLQNEINEGVFETIATMGSGVLGNLLPGFIGRFKQDIATELLESMGANVNSKFGLAVVNIFEELEWMKMKSYFGKWGDGGCEEFIDAILRGLSDSLQEGVLEYFGLEIRSQGVLAGSFRESVTATVNDALLPSIQKPISKFICNIPVGDVLGKLKDVATGKISIKDIFSSGKGKLPDYLKKSSAEAVKKGITQAGSKDDRLSKLAQQFGE